MTDEMFMEHGLVLLHDLEPIDNWTGPLCMTDATPRNIEPSNRYSLRYVL